MNTYNASWVPSTPGSAGFGGFGGGPSGSSHPLGSSSAPGTYSPTVAEPAASTPVTRSRTLFYLSVRDSSTFGAPRRSRAPLQQYGDTIDVEDDERGGLLQDHREHARGHTAGLPPKWVDISDEVEDIINRVQTKVATLDKLHAKHVLPGFTDRSAEEREIERQTNDITRDFRRCSNLITSIAPGRGAPRVEALTAKNVQRGLAQKVQEASAQFRKKQKVYMQKLQGHAIKNKDLLAASGAITLRGPDSYDMLAEDEEASQAQLQSQTSGIPLNIEQRTAEIAQIATSITELSDLFRDLGSLVVAQGTVLDSVEYNVQQTAKQMEDAVEELTVAKRYQSNTGKRRCILLLVLLIVGLIIVLIYKPRRHREEAPPPQITRLGQEGELDQPQATSAVLPEGGGVPARPIPGQDIGEATPEENVAEGAPPEPNQGYPEDYRRIRRSRRSRTARRRSRY